MREDQSEKLDKIFPDGYVVVYTCPDKQIRCAIFNPHNDESLFKYNDLILGAI